MTEQEREEQQAWSRDRGRDDASTVGWHGHTDDFEEPLQQWRPVQTVEVRGERL